MAHYLAFYPSAAMFDTYDLPYQLRGDVVTFDTRKAKSWPVVPVQAVRQADETWRVTLFSPKSGEKNVMIFERYPGKTP